MLDFGFFELLFIMIIGILVIGPKEIPQMMVGLGRIIRRLQYVRFSMSQQFEDFMREHDLQDIRDSVNFEAGHVYGERDFDEEAEDADYIESSPNDEKTS